MLKHCRNTTSSREGLSTVGQHTSRVHSAEKRSASVPPKLERQAVTRAPAAPTPPAGSEQCLISARASVVVYDDIYKKWVPSGSLPTGISKAQILHDPANKTYRVVARKIQDKEVTLNVNLLAGLKYSEATPTFHQWRDLRHTIHGLNFSTKDDAINFSKTMNAVLQVLRHQKETGKTLVTHTTTSGIAPTPLDQQLHIDVPRSHSAASRMVSLHGSHSHDNLLLSRGSSTNLTQQQNGFQKPTSFSIGRGQSLDHNQSANIYASGNQQQQSPPSQQQQIIQHVQPYNTSLHTNHQQDPHNNQQTNNYFQQPAYNNPVNFDHNSNNVKHHHNKELSTSAVLSQSSSTSSSQQDIYSSIPQQLKTPERSSSIGSDMTSSQNGSSQPINQSQPSQDTDLSSSNGAAPIPGPPPPPPMPPGGIPSAPRQAPTNTPPLMNGLAAALQAATLKKTTPKVDTSGVPPPLVGAKANLMEEMQRKLARRRAKADGEDSPCDSMRTSPFHTVSRSNTASPMTVLKPAAVMPSEPQASLRNSPSSGHGSTAPSSSAAPLPSELQQLKRELLQELRLDISQMKLDIVSAIKEQIQGSSNAAR